VVIAMHFGPLTPDTFLCLYAYMMEFPALLHQDELRHHELVCGVRRFSLFEA